MGAEGNTLGLHLLHASVDQMFLHLEVRDPVAEQSTDAAFTLKDRHVVAGARQLLGGGQTCGSGSNDGDCLPGLCFRRTGFHPSLLPGAFDNLLLDLLDGDRITIDVQDAGLFARRRTNPTGKLRKVIGGVQAIDRIGPSTPEDQIVPVRDDISERATGMAKGNAAIHATRSLFAHLALRMLALQLTIVFQPVLDGTPAGNFS
jgi:hypothetical protein